MVKKIVVSPGSEVAAVLEKAAGTSSPVEVDGLVYQVRLVRSSRSAREDIWTGYDADKIREALAETAGSWSDLDVDALLDDIYQARAEGSRPPSRP